MRKKVEIEKLIAVYVTNYLFHLNSTIIPFFIMAVLCILKSICACYELQCTIEQMNSCETFEDFNEH